MPATQELGQYRFQPASFHAGVKERNNEQLAPQVPLAWWLERKKDELKDRKLNPINFIANTAKILVSSKNQVEFGERFSGIISDLTSFVAEHPLSETVGYESRLLSWVRKDNMWKLKGDSGYLDEIMSQAGRSSQVYSFEHPRYRINERNLQLLTLERTILLEDNTGREVSAPFVFVEFSPTPLVTQQTRERGYYGKSCIFFFEFDKKTQTETVTQHWVNATWSQFAELVSELEGMQLSQLMDVGIMSHSRFYIPPEIEKIEKFIKEHRTTQTANFEVEKFVQTELREYLKTQLEWVLLEGARKLLRGEDIRSELAEITATLQIAQEVKLKGKIAQLTGIDMRKIRITPEVERRLDLSPLYRRAFTEENQIPFSGCGGSTNNDLFGDDFSSLGKSVFLITKNTDPMSKPDYTKDPRLCRCGGRSPHFHCPGIKSGKPCRHPIIVGRGTGSCPNCGKGKVC